MLYNPHPIQIADEQAVFAIEQNRARRRAGDFGSASVGRGAFRI
jgi:hypothetical protein